MKKMIFAAIVMCVCVFCSCNQSDAEVSDSDVAVSNMMENPEIFDAPVFYVEADSILALHYYQNVSGTEFYFLYPDSAYVGCLCVPLYSEEVIIGYDVLRFCFDKKQKPEAFVYQKGKLISASAHITCTTEKKEEKKYIQIVFKTAQKEYTKERVIDIPSLTLPLPKGSVSVSSAFKGESDESCSLSQKYTLTHERAPYSDF